MKSGSTDEAIGHLLREYAPQVLGALSRRNGDFVASEDAVQEALIAAASQWPVSGVPDNPLGWLYRVARRRMADHVRSEEARRSREEEVVRQSGDDRAAATIDDELAVEADDSLLLLFMCCHPALSPASSVALTLRAVGGLTTREIAAAFLVPEATMAQRISRAKLSIRESGLPFQMPTDSGRGERLAAVLQVLYLVFNEGYTTSSGPALQRADLSAEAIRLMRAVHEQLPSDSEATGLLALMLLTDARKAARTGANGELIPLDEQDRSLWNKPLIQEGIALVDDAMRSRSPGYYLLQAAVAALHDEASSAADTDWAQIHALYGVLLSISDNPMVALNHAIAAAMANGAQAGLDLVSALETDARMKGHYRIDAVKGHLFQMLGENDKAIVHYLGAAERTLSIPERDYLKAKAARLSVRV